MVMSKEMGQSWAPPVRFCGVMKAWKADVSLFRLGDSKPLRSPRGDCTGKQAHLRVYATSNQGSVWSVAHDKRVCQHAP